MKIESFTVVRILHFGLCAVLMQCNFQYGARSVLYAVAHQFAYDLQKLLRSFGLQKEIFRMTQGIAESAALSMATTG